MNHLIKMSIWTLWAALACQSVPAKNYGLVVGGFTQDLKPVHHDMARISAAVSLGMQGRGYEVVTLFGSPPKSGAAELRQFKIDYEYFKSKKLYGPESFAAQWLTSDSSATVSNLEKYFNRLIKTVAKDDNVDIYLAVHGSQNCSGLARPDYPGDLDTWCSFVFGLYDYKGGLATYSGERIAKHVRSLESTGAKVNLIFHTCHSGRCKGEFSGLKDACVFYGSSGVSTGHICIESDFEENPRVESETSLLEMMGLHYYHLILPELSRDPYFTQSKCFQAIRKHYAGHASVANLTSIAETYWSFRSLDKTIHEPSLNTLESYRYFNRDNFSKALRDSVRHGQRAMKILDQSALDELHSGLGQLIEEGHGKGSARIADLVESQLKRLNATVSDYNQAVQAEKAHSPREQADAAEHAKLQREVDKAAQSVLAAERSLVDLIRRYASGRFAAETSPCLRRE